MTVHWQMAVIIQNLINHCCHALDRWSAWSLLLNRFPLCYSRADCSGQNSIRRLQLSAARMVKMQLVTPHFELLSLSNFITEYSPMFMSSEFLQFLFDAKGKRQCTISQNKGVYSYVQWKFNLRFTLKWRLASSWNLSLWYFMKLCLDKIPKKIFNINVINTITPDRTAAEDIKIYHLYVYIKWLHLWLFVFFSKVTLHVSLEMSVPCLSINSQKWPLKTSQKILIVNQMINRDQEVQVRQWATQLLTARGWDNNNIMRWDMATDQNVLFLIFGVLHGPT